MAIFRTLHIAFLLTFATVGRGAHEVSDMLYGKHWLAEDLRGADDLKVSCTNVSNIK